MRQSATQKKTHSNSELFGLASTGLSRITYSAALFFIILVFSFAYLGFSSNVAYADYENLSVSGVAQVNTDASLHVTEQRAFSFSEPYSALEWNIPGIKAGNTVNVTSVRALKANEVGKSTGKWRVYKEVPFNSSWRKLVSQTGGLTEAMKDYFKADSLSASNAYITKPKNYTYSFDETNDIVYFFPKDVKNNTVYECDYTISNMANIYDDVAELYWQYCLPTGDKVAKDISMKIQLPVPENAKVIPNENVYAWGHGPEGSLEIRKDGVINIEVSQVNPGQYCQVHIVFPRSWLKNVDMKSESYKTGTRIGYALAEEDGWTDTESVSKMNRYLLSAILCAIGFVALLISLFLYLIFGREKPPAKSHKGDLANTNNAASAEQSMSEATSGESSEVPLGMAVASDGCKALIENYNPAICGRLLRWNQHSAYDLAYVLQRLIEEGAVQITASDDPGKTRLRLSPSSKTVDLDEIDKAALYLLFESIGDGYQSISINDIRDYCHKDPATAFKTMKRWQDVVSECVDKANLFDRASKHACHVVLAIAAFVAIIGIMSAIFSVSLWACLIAFACALACAAIAYKMPRRTQVGVDLADELERCGFADNESRPVWEIPLANAFGYTLTA